MKPKSDRFKVGDRIHLHGPDGNWNYYGHIVELNISYNKVVGGWIHKVWLENYDGAGNSKNFEYADMCMEPLSPPIPENMTAEEALQWLQEEQ